MKLKEFGPPGGARPKFYYVDPPTGMIKGRDVRVPKYLKDANARTIALPQTF